MNELKLLGQPELRRADGYLDHSFLAGSKRLVLLAYLILHRPRGLQRRDKILPLLWPEKGQKSGRNALSNILYHIRKTLGKESVVTRGTEELGVDPEKIQCDALIFEELMSIEKMEEAATLYRGDLLEGLHISNTSPDLEDWLDRERDFFREKYWKVLETLAVTEEENGRLDQAYKWWKKRSLQDPFDSRVARRQIEILMASGNRSEAMKVARSHALYLKKELDLDEHEVISELTSGLKKSGTLSRSSVQVARSEIPEFDKFSIGVLPFEELGSDEQTSNFASGLHNDLLTRLSGVSTLNVISRMSVLSYRNTTKKVYEVAEELGTGTVVEGSIQFRRGRVKLNIQLIDVKTNSNIWAETYDREFTAEHFFDIQSELALKITQSLKARLTPSEKKRVVEWAPTDDLEAHRLYTHGRKQLDQRTGKGIKRAMEYFQSAVEQDPDHALAWVGLADALALQYDYGHANMEQTLPRAEEAVNRALKLDSNLAEVYTSLGLIYSNRHKGSRAVKELKRAVELQPSYAEAHNWLSWNYQLLGQHIKALESAKKAVSLNPLSPEAVSNLSVSYLYNGCSEKALSEALRGVELQADWGTLAFYHGLALFDLERYSEAKQVLEGLSTPWAGNGPLTTLALCHSMTDDLDEAKKIQSKLETEGDTFSKGLIEAAFGNSDRALELFDQVDDWESLTIHHLYPVILDPIRKQTRFHKIKKRVEKFRGKY